MQFKPQSEFPLLAEFKRRFAVSERTCFAYGDCLYADYRLTDDLLEHEKTHLKQQKKYGLDNFVARYLADNKFRLKVETEAYRRQLASIRDRERRNLMRAFCATELSGGLYGNIIDYKQAFLSLKI